VLRSHEENCAHTLSPAEMPYLFPAVSHIDHPPESEWDVLTVARLLAREHLRQGRLGDEAAGL
jgi:hypothetical protein